MQDAFIAFLSYARRDNTGNKIDGLHKLLEEELGIALGKDVKVFFDKDIPTAALWQSKIDAALKRSTFLLALVTPSYINSDWCEKELRAFSEYSKDHGDNTIIPIHYVDCAILDRAINGDKEFVEILRQRQINERVDWRKLRLQPTSSEDTRAKVHELSKHMADVYVALQEKREEITAPAGLAGKAGSAAPASQEPGGLDSSQANTLIEVFLKNELARITSELKNVLARQAQNTGQAMRPFDKPDDSSDTADAGAQPPASNEDALVQPDAAVIPDPPSPEQQRLASAIAKTYIRDGSFTYIHPLDAYLDRLRQALQDGDISRADQESVSIIREVSGARCIDCFEKAMAVPRPLLLAMNELWKASRHDTAMTSRKWFIVSSDVTTIPPGFFTWYTWLERRFNNDKLYR